jgi:hypothetical protein
MPNDYFPLAIPPNITRLPFFSYISLSGITTKTHFTPDFTKETPEKSRIDTLLRARAFAIRFAILTSYPAKQDLLDLKFYSLLVYLRLDRIAYAKPEFLCDNRQNSSYN